MLITLPRATLFRLADAAFALAAPSKRAECRHVLARCAAGTLTLRATRDTETALTLALADVAGAEDGECLLPPKLKDVLRETPDGDVRLECTPDAVTLLSGPGLARRHELPTAPVSTFPDLPHSTGEPNVEVAAADLLAALGRVAFAAARQEGKYAMEGVCFKPEGEKVTLAATDGKSLAVGPLPGVVRNPLPEGSLIVPTGAVDAIERLVRELADDAVCAVAFCPAGNSVTVTTPGGAVWARLLEGQFPNFRSVIPRPREIRFKVPLVARDFEEAVRAAAVMSDDESKRVKFDFSAGKVLLTARGASTGSSAVPLELPDYPGGEVSVSLDPKYVLGFLREVPGAERLELRMVSGEKSCVFQRESGDAIWLLVPLV